MKGFADLRLCYAAARQSRQDTMSSPYVTLTSRIAYENRWTRVREDRIRHSDGADGLYGVVERADFALIVPWQDGRGYVGGAIPISGR